MNDIKVIIDVGAKCSEYPDKYPDAVCHLFEPNPRHFKVLWDTFKDNKNVILNNYGLGEMNEMLPYDPHTESCISGTYRDYVIEIKTLDWYIEENKITRLDFLKIDAEGMDYEILLGGAKAIQMARYIQYETWDNGEKFKELLGGFTFEDLGERNILCKKN